MVLLALAVRWRRDAGTPFWVLLLVGVAAPVIIYVLHPPFGLYLALGIPLCLLLSPAQEREGLHAQEGAVAPEPPEHEPEERVGEQGKGQPAVSGEERV